MSTRFSGKIGQEYRDFALACPHFNELEGLVGKVIREHFKTNQNERLSALEIGCGPGYTTQHIVEADPRIVVNAVDNEPLMIGQASEELSDYVEQGRVQLHTSSALEYLSQLPENSVDVVASAYAMHNFDNGYRKEVLAEIYRVLRPGGLLVNADKIAHDSQAEHNDALTWQIGQFWTQYPSIGKEYLAVEWTKHYLEDNHPNVIMRAGETTRLMDEIGYENVEIGHRKYMDAVLTATKPLQKGGS
ncbi:hypothetical protein BVX95_02280 [archaeon D22]|nr:hypothetical protein BVX95_02280 [archaeon D22]